MSATEKWRYEITSSCQELFSQLSLFLDPSSTVPIIPFYYGSHDFMGDLCGDVTAQLIWPSWSISVAIGQGKQLQLGGELFEFKGKQNT